MENVIHKEKKAEGETQVCLLSQLSLLSVEQFWAITAVGLSTH